MRYGIVIGCCLVAACLVGGPAQARVDVGLNLNFSVPLQWAPVPGLPVYYGTNAPTNIFQYNGQYYVFDSGTWYVAPTYSGPWMVVAPQFIPAILSADSPSSTTVRRRRTGMLGARRRRPAGRSSTARPGRMSGLPGALPVVAGHRH